MRVESTFAMLALALLLRTGEPAAGTEPDAPVANEELDRVVRAWRERLDTTRNLRFRREGKCLIPREYYKDEDGRPLLFADHELDVVSDWVVDVENHRYRCSRESEVFYETKRRWDYILKAEGCDRECRWGFHPNFGQSPDAPEVWIGKRPADGVGQSWVSVDFPVFFAHGIFPVAGPLDWTKCREASVDSLDWKAVGRAEVNDHRCLVVEANSSKRPELVVRMHVAPKLDDAILRAEWRLEGERFRLIETKFEQQDERWSPHSWTVEERDPYAGEVVSTYSLKRKSYEANARLNDEDFAPPLEPGMIVDDQRQGQIMVVNEDGKTLSRRLAN